MKSGHDPGQGNRGLDGIEEEGNNELGREHGSWVCRFSRSCDRLISPYGKGIGNRPFSLFPVETLIENFATCGLRPTGWPATSSRVTGRIGARSVPNLNLRRRTRRHASFQRGFGSKTFGRMGEKLETMNTFSRNVVLLFTISFYSFLLPPAEFDTSFCFARKRTRHASEFRGSRGEGVVSLFSTSIRVYFCCLLFLRRLGCWRVKRKKKSRGILLISLYIMRIIAINK